nr:hypothetical protein K-LCC10_0333 [Kaumoebavirus]
MNALTAEIKYTYRVIIRWYIYVAVQIVLDGETVLADKTVTDLFVSTAISHTIIEFALILIKKAMINVAPKSEVTPVTFVTIFAVALTGSTKPCIALLQPLASKAVASQLSPQPLLNRGLNMAVDYLF